jgi:hypothetical protein
MGTMGNVGRELPDGVLGLECEAFLNGSLAELWEERGTGVPVWTWTNLLAHGSATQIHDSLRRPAKQRWTGRSWRIARSYLAHQVLEVATEDYTLEELQLRTLLPLELALAARCEVEHWTPRRWLDTVDEAIRDQHSPLGF